jgi:predicted secreted protein
MIEEHLFAPAEVGGVSWRLVKQQKSSRFRIYIGERPWNECSWELRLGSAKHLATLVARARAEMTAAVAELGLP